ncbi:hypothetical protein [Actinocorallia sp. A-T 12471]|uniref:hypothetical protein n=1 Tax=Actinocorallia sp. A-T 12471 TaxID=3089813 RepID=UPI0029CEBEAC|nr:hypothetical protein [Actinocorallia sp. A-T 12471]MDX6740179.1 hypothetical protein [Actinocorallia sp. A-T 12471]
MPTAVIRVIVDAAGVLTPAQYDAGIGRLTARGLEVIASTGAHLAECRREIEIIADDLDHGRSAADYAALCEASFGLSAELGVTTFISRGTDEDALGVLTRFGLAGDVTRTDDGDEELVTVTLARADSRKVPESRLHTALEAALNCKVHLNYT